jgi:DNA-binding LacI/PurR family transcriptional regulator
VVTVNSSLYGPASTLNGIEQAALESQYSMTVASLRFTDRAAVREAISRLVGQGVEGIVVIAPLMSLAEAVEDLPTGLPVVVVEGDANADIDTVTVDQFAGAQAATAYLLALGHPTVWHVTGPADWLEARQRTNGWRATLEDAGADVPPPFRGDWSARSGFEAGRILSQMPEVSAVFAGNDSMAVGVLRAFRESGRTIPGDVSLVGFDDVPEAAYYSPPLTTVRQDFGEVGRRSLALLLEHLEAGPREPRRVVVAANLVVRQSTAATTGMGS